MTNERTDKTKQYVLSTSLKLGHEITSLKHDVIAYISFTLHMGMILTGVSVVSILQPFQKNLKLI